MVKNNSINAALPIVSSKGGTGVNNGVRTITLGGNMSTGNTLTTTGTFATGGNFATGSTFSTTGAFTTGGALTTANAFSTSGNFGLTLTTTALTNITLPTTGTLATLAGVETLSNKNFTGTINGIFNGNVDAWFFHNTVSANVGQTSIYFQRNSTIVGTILTTLTTTSYNTTSDGRLKSNRIPIDNAGEIIDQLEPIHYTWNHVKGNLGGTGFIAQDVYKLIPECIVKGDENPDLRPHDFDFEQWGADWTAMVPYLVAEIKSLRARVKALEDKNVE